MTLEEADKKIEFILQMQAQFAANLARSEANVDNLRVSVADLAGVVRESVKISDDRFTRFDERMKDLAVAQKATEERLGELAGAQRAADERSTRLGERMIELAAAQKATEERLNALINVLEKHITGPNHGHPTP